MAIDQETEMTDVQIDDFLRRRETGVLSLARTDEPYAIPISYGYDDGEREFYMRMVSTPDSEKRQFLESAPEARLVVYDEADSTYRSVIATGCLEHRTVGADAGRNRPVREREAAAVRNLGGRERRTKYRTLPAHADLARRATDGSRSREVRTESSQRHR